MAVNQHDNRLLRDKIRLPGSDLRRHLADALLPNVAFLVGYEAEDWALGVALAVGVALVLVAVRLRRRRPPKLVAVSFGVVLVHAATVAFTGEGRDFFLSWLVLNVALTAVFLGSLVIGRPISAQLLRLVGLAGDAVRHRRVTALWLVLWLLHLAVSTPLYLADMVVALGLAHFVLGPPAWLAWGVITWRMLAPAVDEEGPR